ncbi:MAG: type III secretion system cytoplasmic ring protein SctQ [Chlamydiae bacterium]|nr:type III secretion system cytoplasmic ring protein SctQ [Chlamydiota bacterium]
MNKMHTAPLSLIKSVDFALKELGTTPIWGFPPSISWEDLANNFAQVFHVNKCKISPSQTQFRKKENLLDGFEKKNHLISILLTPLTGKAFWILGQQDAAKLTAKLLLEEKAAKGFSTDSLRQGFHFFLCLKALGILQKEAMFEDFSFKMEEAISLPEENAFSIDISIYLDTLKIWGRLIISNELKESFKQHFALRKTDLLREKRIQDLFFPLKMEIGNVTIPLPKWKKISVGDLILLDKCSLNPDEWKGICNVSLANTSLFQARIKANEVKIFEYAFFQKEELMIEENEDEIMLPDEEFEEEKKLSKEKQNLSEKLVSTKEIPLTIRVEVGRIKMKLEKILELEPGTVLELPIGPEHGVFLSIDGQLIGKGELVKIGERVGVKILQIEE